MLDGRVLEASQVEYKPFGKPPLQREAMPFGSLALVYAFLRTSLAIHALGARLFRLPWLLRQFPDCGAQAARQHSHTPDQVLVHIVGFPGQ